MKTAAIIQARMNSTRFPGKIMEDIRGEAMLARVVERVSKSKLLDDIIVATTTRSYDNIVAKMCLENHWTLFRGDEDDVLDRYYQAAKSFGVDIIVRITADCPLIDPGMIDYIVGEYDGPLVCDYISNVVNRTFPRGLDTEVFSFHALDRIWKEAGYQVWRENVTLYILQNQDKFRVASIEQPVDMSWMRWTVDEPADLEFVRAIYANFPESDFDWEDVERYVKNDPEVFKINSSVRQKKV